jgi:hypothetical protein
MLRALALYASTASAGIPARFGGTLGVVNENTPRYDLEPVGSTISRVAWHGGRRRQRSRWARIIALASVNRQTRLLST